MAIEKWLLLACNIEAQRGRCNRTTIAHSTFLSPPHVQNFVTHVAIEMHNGFDGQNSIR